MARALRSEISAITAFLNTKKNSIREIISENNGNKNITFSMKNSRDLIIPPSPQVYDRCMEKIGLLPPKTSEDVMDYYGYLKVATRVVSEKIATYTDEMGSAEALEIADWFDEIDNKCIVAMSSLSQFLKDSGGSTAKEADPSYGKQASS